MTRHLIDRPRTPNDGLRLSRFLSLARQAAPNRNTRALARVRRLRAIRSGRLEGLLKPQRAS